MSDSLLQALERHPFVSDFAPRDQARLAAIAKEVQFTTDQVIFHEGDDYSVLYLLGKGMVALELELPGSCCGCRPSTAATCSTGRRCCRMRASTSRRGRSTPVAAFAFEGDAPPRDRLFATIRSSASRSCCA